MDHVPNYSVISNQEPEITCVESHPYIPTLGIILVTSQSVILYAKFADNIALLLKLLKTRSCS